MNLSSIKEKNPLEFGPLTDMANIMERIANAEEFLPEICTLDCGTLNFGDSSVITVNTPNDLRKAAKRLQEINVKPEIEAFDLVISGKSGALEKRIMEEGADSKADLYIIAHQTTCFLNQKLLFQV